MEMTRNHEPEVQTTLPVASGAFTSRLGSSAPHLALLLVQIAFGTFPIAGKIALREIPSTGVVMFRIAGAALLFCFIYNLTARSEHEQPVRGVRAHLWLAVLSLLGVVLNQFMFVKGLEMSTVINATLLGVAIPVWTLLVSFTLKRERLSLRTAAGVLLAMAGVVYLIDPARADLSSGTTLGNLLLILNTAAYGIYIALSQNAIKRYGALTVITYLFVIGTIAAVPIGSYGVSGTALDEVSARAWLAIAYIVLVPTVFAYYLNAWALGHVPPSVVATYIYLQPLIAFALAPIFLGERTDGRTWVAAALIFAGVAATTMRRNESAVSDAMSKRSRLQNRGTM